MTQVTEPFPIFYDDDGTPLDDGMIYVGQANQDPRVNPVTVYTDEARTIPIAQPIRTLGGRPAYQGAPINLYVAETAYSIAVQNRFGTPIVSAPDVSLNVFGAQRSDVFTGNGATLSFTLTTSPGTIENCQVFIDGVRQTPTTDYLLSGVTLTFVEAPYNGANIFVNYAEVLTVPVASANDVNYQASGSNTVSRPVEAKLREIVSVPDFTSVSTADADARAKYVPPGTYSTTLTATDLDGPYWGRGQIIDTGGNKRAPEFSAIKAPPSSFGNWDSPDTAFNGDLSKMQRVSEHRISGATTLGQPTTGYTLRREGMAEALYGFVSSDAGHNQSTTTNDGRTGAAFWQRQVFHAGNGDAYCNWVTGIATGTKSGSTHFLANPAIAAYSGQVYGGASGVYLQGVGDLNFDDLGFDVAAQGITFNFIRTNKTGAKQTDWTGIRMQSVGTEEMDAWCSFVGLADRGIDMSKSNFGANQAAFTLAANQRFYGNSTNVDSVSLPRNTTLGNAWFTYDSANSAWAFATQGSAAALFNNSVFAIYGRVTLSLANVGDYADDAAAAAGGYAIGQVYRTGSALKVRVA